jgi:aryl-alcohol dehydrogenase-like predicted oxidoreductase
MTDLPALPSFTDFTLGTSWLHDLDNPEHLAVARRGMEAGVWFHTAPSYGKGATYRLLRRAFDEAPSRKPRCIFKVNPDTPQTMRDGVEQGIAATGVERIDVAQLLDYHIPDADRDLQPGCAFHDEMHRLIERGLVGTFVLETQNPITANHLKIVRERLFPGYAFYYNLVNRNVSGELFDLFMERGEPIVAIRAVGGKPGDLGRTPDDRAEEVRRAIAELVEQAGCADEMELRTRFTLSVPNVATTIGGTTKVAHLERFLRDARRDRALPPELVQRIHALHRDWFDNGR